MPGLWLEQEKIIEAVLFVSGDSLSAKRLAEIIGLDVSAVRELLIHMAERYAAENAGIQLVEMDDAFQLCINPAYYPYAQKLLQAPPRKALTQPLLETLSIIAYKQPITKSVIEEIRGVNADHAVNKLLEYGLITEKGRLDAPGKPLQFGTSEAFLRYFGLRNLESLFARHRASEEAVSSNEA